MLRAACGGLTRPGARGLSLRRPRAGTRGHVVGTALMHLPAPSPPLRGVLLRLLARLTAVAPVRDLLLAKVRRDAGIPQLSKVIESHLHGLTNPARPGGAP
jgi:hypothetical protein